MNIIYLSYDGMTDPLGQAQVLPYITGLSQKGVRVTLISFEKKERYVSGKSTIQRICTENNIDWQPFFYTKNPPILSTLWDIFRLNKKIKQLQKKKQVSLIHCRSYITALIGLGFKKRHNIPFLFDMRGFWADERIDGNIWNIKMSHYKWIYNFFKRKEKEFLSHADYTVSLTYTGKHEIESWQLNNPSPIEVIPCCTDTRLFNNDFINVENQSLLRTKLNLTEKDNIISYLGSLGTWYMLDEMLDFFSVFIDKNSDNKALFITKDNPANIIKIARSKNLDLSKLIIVSSERRDVPLYLSLSKASVFFIKPLFSKKASSATKMGEIMNLGIPVICNDIGDNSSILADISPELMVKNFNTEEYNRVLESLTKIDSDTFRSKIIHKARTYFSLETGINKYWKIYKSIAQQYPFEHGK